MNKHSGRKTVTLVLAMGLMVALSSGCAAEHAEARTPSMTAYGYGAPSAPLPPPPIVAAPQGYAAPPTVGMIPAARPPARSGPPQNWAWLHTPPYGCSTGPLSLEIDNQTRYFMAVLMDGKKLRVRGADGELPQIPPGETAYVCLNDLGDHTIDGVAYAGAYGNLVEVDRFHIRETFSVSTMATWGRQAFTINDQRLRWY